MKIRNLLLASAFVLGFASCSNSEIPSSKTQITDGDIKLKIDIASVGTSRVADDAVNNGQKSSIQKVDIYLLSPSAVQSSYTITGADIDKLTSADGYVLEKINGNVENVALVVNKGTDTDRLPAGTAISELKRLALAADLNQVQPTADNKGVKNAQMYGISQGISDSGAINSSTGNSLYVANINLYPAIARVQVYGNVKTSSEITNFKVTKIFLDNLYKNSGVLTEEGKFQVETNVDPQLKTLLDGVGIFDMNTEGLPMFAQKADGVYAYHIFPQEAIQTAKPKNANVKLLIEMQYDAPDPENAGATKSFTEYATLRLAKGNGDVVDPATLNIEQAKIYTIDLGKIDWTGDGKYVDPSTPDVEDEDKDKFNPGDGGETPNQDQKDLKILVTIQDWAEIDIIPQN